MTFRELANWLKTGFNNSMSIDKSYLDEFNKKWANKILKEPADQISLISTQNGDALTFHTKSKGMIYFGMFDKTGKYHL